MLGRVTWGLGRGRGGGGGRRWGGGQSPGSHVLSSSQSGMACTARPGDAHLRSEVSGACRDLCLLLETLGRTGRVHIYLHICAELLQFTRVVTRDAAVRGPGARLASSARPFPAHADRPAPTCQADSPRRGLHGAGLGLRDRTTDWRYTCHRRASHAPGKRRAERALPDDLPRVL